MDTTQGIQAWESVTFAFLAAQGWKPEGATLLLAVSGGADSTALLHFFARSGRAKFGCRLAVAHINHGLRPAASADEAFVAALCAEYDLPLHRLNLDPSKKPARESTEMWARRERYRFFAEAADTCGAHFVLTAHHRDDLVETVLQRLHRGTGPRGLAGIPFQRNPGILRPFLNRSHRELLVYLEMLQAPWREDESNLDLHINRNWFRHSYLPQLRKTEMDVDNRIFAMAMELQAIGTVGMDALEAEADLLARDATGRPFLSVSGLKERVDGEDGESLGYWLRALVHETLPQSPRHSVTKEILDEFSRQWQRSCKSLQVPIAHGIALKFENNGIYCVESTSRSAELGRLTKKSGSRELQKGILDGTVSTLFWEMERRTFKLTVRRYARPMDLVYPAASEGRAIFDAGLFSSTLVVRTRRNGDCFSPFGVQSRTRKLKAFLNEKKVPIRMRDSLPIVVNDETLAWVPGFGISEFYKVTDTTTSILELVLTCENL